MARQSTTQIAETYGTLLLAVSIAPSEIGGRIKRAREGKGWTQMVFAQEANVSMSSVQRWERGDLPPVRELMRISDLLGVATEELVEPEEAAQSSEEILRRLATEAERFERLNDRLELLLQEPNTLPRSGRSRRGEEPPHAKDG